MTTYTINNRLPEYTIPGKGKLIITKELQDQIDYLHKQVGNIEWCGTLFYEKQEGNITDPKSLVFIAKRLYLMDIGSHSYTEAKFTGETVIDMFETVPEAEELQRGLIHTHHSMSR